MAREVATPEALAEQPINTARRFSAASIESEEDNLVFQGSNVRHPHRQPGNAPQGNLAQTDAGFARFLKEHASPKHHRVTAGGRIVPTSPISPPPEFKLLIQKLGENAKNDDSSEVAEKGVGVSSTNQSYNIGNDTFHHKAVPKLGTVMQMNFGSSGPQNATNSAPQSSSMSMSPPNSMSAPNHPIHYQNTLPLDPHQFAPTSAPSTMPTPVFQPAFPVNLSNAEARPMPVQQSAFATDYPSVVPAISLINVGGEQRVVFANGTQYPLSNLSAAENLAYPAQHPFLTALNVAPSNFAGLGQQNILPGMNAMPANMLGLYQPLPNFTISSPATVYQSASLPNATGNAMLGQPMSTNTQPVQSEKSLREVTNKHSVLVDSLDHLDRYLAIHTSTMDPATKQSTVRQRVELVMKIDAARKQREHLEVLANLKATTSDVHDQVPPARGTSAMPALLRHATSSSDLNVQAPAWTPDYGQMPYRHTNQASSTVETVRETPITPLTPATEETLFAFQSAHNINVDFADDSARFGNIDLNGHATRDLGVESYGLSNNNDQETYQNIGFAGAESHAIDVTRTVQRGPAPPDIHARQLKEAEELRKAYEAEERKTQGMMGHGNEDAGGIVETNTEYFGDAIAAHKKSSARNCGGDNRNKKAPPELQPIYQAIREAELREGPTTVYLEDGTPFVVPGKSNDSHWSFVGSSEPESPGTHIWSDPPHNTAFDHSNSPIAKAHQAFVEDRSDYSQEYSPLHSSWVQGIGKEDKPRKWIGSGLPPVDDDDSSSVWTDDSSKHHAGG